SRERPAREDDGGRAPRTPGRDRDRRADAGDAAASGQLARYHGGLTLGMHTVYVGVGSNLGDRQSTILAALQRLRREASVEAVSSYYETPPAGGCAGP